MLAGQHGITRANCSQVRNALVAQGLGVRGRSCHRQLRHLIHLRCHKPTFLGVPCAKAQLRRRERDQCWEVSGYSCRSI